MAKKEKEVKDKQKNKNFLKEIQMELKKVTWPTPKELVNNTVAVISFVLIIAIIVFILDFCFDKLNKYGITNLQEKIQASLSTQSESSENSEEESNSAESETENLETITNGDNSEENNENQGQE